MATTLATTGGWNRLRAVKAVMRPLRGARFSIPTPGLDRLRRGLARYHLKDRLLAWWEGYEYRPPPPEEEEAPPPAPAITASAEPFEALDAQAVRGWSDSRIALVQALFGDGFVSAGGEQAVRAMIKPLALDESMSVVEIGAGLGGVARLIAKETGAWVTGYEEDVALAAAAAEISTRLGLGRKAMVEQGCLTEARIRHHTIDAVVSKEAIYRVADKEALFAAVQKALKPGGQIMFKDFMLGERGGNGPALAAWTELEGRSLHFWEVDRTRAALKNLGFRVPIAEDVSDEYRHHVLEAFSELADMLRRGEVDEALRPWAISEGDLWARRVAALESGEVKVYRVYGNLPEAPPE